MRLNVRKSFKACRQDKQFLRTPFYGWPKMTAHLRRLGYAINGKRVRRLMRLMGIQAIYPRRSSSSPGKGHKRYPYLLRNLPITHVNQVWSADITYVPLLRGFMYLVAVIDWHSRYVLAWQLSNTLTASSVSMPCARRSARGGPRSSTPTRAHSSRPMLSRPPCSQPTFRSAWTGAAARSTTLSCERLWRSVKYENVYLQQYDSVRQLQAGLSDYFDFYNHEVKGRVVCKPPVKPDVKFCHAE